MKQYLIEFIKFVNVWPQEVVIGLLILILVMFWWRIRYLKRKLKQVSGKQYIPVILFDIDSKDPGIFLKNEGNCYVKDIVIEDLKLLLDYDFKKDLVLKFSKIGFIKPNERIKIDFRIFDGELEIPAREADKLNVHMANSVFEVHLTCANIEDKRFRAVLLKDKEGFHIKEIVPG